MTGPGDGIAAAGRGYLRTSDAEREHAVGWLKTAFVQGRLTKDELELRAGLALSSRTYAELATVTADLPTEPAAGLPSRAPARARPPMNNTLKAALLMAATVAALTVILWVAAFLTGDNRVVEITFLATLADFAIIPMIAFVTAAQALDERQQKRSMRDSADGGHRLRSAILVIATRSA